jgi:polysaccharide chain length determinant protein (PEP-CTERM system associated)
MKNLENLTVSDYIAIFRRRLWYVLVITVLVTAGTVIYVKQLPSIYRSETTIAIAGRFLPEDYIRSMDRQTDANRMDFVRQQLQSRSFLEGIVQEFHLAGPDGLQRAAEVVGSKIEITVFTSNAFKLGFSSTNPLLAQSITNRLAERIIQSNDSFRKEKVHVADQFLEEQFNQAANELAEAEQKIAELRNRAFPDVGSEVITPDTLRDLRLQLSKLDSDLDSARVQRKSLQRRLEENRQLKLVLKAPPPPPPPSTQAPTTSANQAPASLPPTPLEIELASKRTQLAAALTHYTRLYPEVIRLTQEVRQLESLVNQESAARQALAAKMTIPPKEPKEQPKEESKPAPSLPELDTLVDLVPIEIRAELDRVSDELSKTEEARNALLAKISAYEQRLSPRPELAQELAELTRAHDAAKQRYNVLAEKRLSSEMAVRVDSSDSNEMFKVIDAAYLPRVAVGPNRRMLASLGGLVGLVLGLGFAFLRDYLDPSLHNEDDAIAELKLPVLASIPFIVGEPNDNLNKERVAKIAGLKGNQEDPRSFSIWEANSKIRNVILNPLCMAREHYALLNTQLLAMQKARQLRTILVSSAHAHEGKTLSACCIAGMLSKEAGKKVLLIDADLRRPNVANVLGLGHRQFPNNFSAVLRGEIDIEESMIRCENLNLYFVPAGPGIANPAEVLNSPQLEAIIRRCKEDFDLVIVDSPPILAAADVNIISPFFDGMLLVVHSAKTPAKMIKSSVKRVGQDRILGLLMNQVRTSQAGYYNGYYSGYYAAPVEESPRKSILKA